MPASFPSLGTRAVPIESSVAAMRIFVRTQTIGRKRRPWLLMDSLDRLVDSHSSAEVALGRVAAASGNSKTVCTAPGACARTTGRFLQFEPSQGPALIRRVFGGHETPGAIKNGRGYSHFPWRAIRMGARQSADCPWQEARGSKLRPLPRNRTDRQKFASGRTAFSTVAPALSDRGSGRGVGGRDIDGSPGHAGICR